MERLEKMKNYFVNIIFFVFLISFALGASVQAYPITVQGKISSSNTIASPINLSFALWTAQTAGTLVAIRFQPGVNIVDGVFNTTVDFGDDIAFGKNYYLESSIYGTGISTQVFSPRQQLTAAPYASANVLKTGDAMTGTLTVKTVNPAGISAEGITGIYGKGLVGVAGDGLVGVSGHGIVGVGGNGTGNNSVGVYGIGVGVGGSFESVSGYGIYSKAPKNYFSGTITASNGVTSTITDPNKAAIRAENLNGSNMGIAIEIIGMLKMLTKVAVEGSPQTGYWKYFVVDSTCGRIPLVGMNTSSSKILISNQFVGSNSLILLTAENALTGASVSGKGIGSFTINLLNPGYFYGDVSKAYIDFMIINY